MRRAGVLLLLLGLLCQRLLGLVRHHRPGIIVPGKPAPHTRPAVGQRLAALVLYALVEVALMPLLPVPVAAACDLSGVLMFIMWWKGSETMKTHAGAMGISVWKVLDALDGVEQFFWRCNMTLRLDAML